MMDTPKRLTHCRLFNGVVKLQQLQADPAGFNESDTADLNPVDF